ncbi:hypothetical protein CUS_6025 [Ruminococcus albus 8]|uniref:Fibronectin type III domain protein n=1 Tax=Ruminococcus albus 8 TaxID=246199 RepID=E9SD13_RUMAL|nr:fibronectin type III domain-containing protein [Ruminococcus albus]EGC02760.1 hypothetical protein CUS_6025 [Ruminococcus albus 8]
MKNKRLVAGLLALTFVFGGAVLPEKNADNIAVVSASAAENGDSDTYIGGAISCGDYFIGVKEDGTCDIVSYIGTDSILEIPAEIDGHIVTGIARSAFEDTITFTEVKIPEGVTYIGEGAFYGLSDLKKVELPSTVEIIERAAFSRCDSLESVKLSEGLLTIEEFAFSECTSLQNIEFPKSLKTIGTHAFSFNGLVTVSLPDGLTTLGRDVFLGCEDLIAAYIPGSLETIPMCAFMGCASLNDLVICDGVKNIGEQAFSYCDALEQVMLPDSVTDVLLGNFNNSTIYCNSGSYAESFAIDNGLDLYIYDADMSIKPEITYEMGDGCVKLTWDAVEGADKYAVAGYVDGKWKSLATGDGTSYVLKGLKYNTSYRVAVFPRINGVWNRNSTNNIFVRTYYTTPKIRGLGYNKEHNRFSVEWRPVDTAEQYAVCMYKDGKWIAKAYVDGSKNEFTSPKCDAGEYTMAICTKVGGKWYKNQLDDTKFTVTIK